MTSTRFDTSTLNKALLGFDSLFNSVDSRIASQLNSTYPPYNILKHSDDSYELEVAVTGFSPDEITVEIDRSQLIIKGVRDKSAETDTQYLHRSLATRDFTRTWTLAEHMEVGEGKIKNGVLRIALTRVIPEELKLRQLKITVE
jgi:molecular chaperone IbpA